MSSLGTEDANPPLLSAEERATAFKEGPPKFPRKYIWIGIAIAAVLGIGGAYADQSFNVPSVAPKPAAAQAKTVSNSLAHFVGLRLLGGEAAPALPLVDQNGDRFALTQLRGRTVIVTFLSPTCDDICPVVGAELRQAATDLGGGRAGVATVAVNADPGETGPLAAVGALARDGLAGMPDPYFLSGALAVLNRVWAHYGVTLEYDPTNHQLAHTNVLYVISPTGRLEYALEPFGNESANGTFSLAAPQITRFASGIAHYVAVVER